MSRRLADRLLASAHPRLGLLVIVGAVLALVGVGLALLGPSFGPGTRRLGLRLAVLGGLVFLVGASGYVAFAVFERGFD